MDRMKRTWTTAARIMVTIAVLVGLVAPTRSEDLESFSAPRKRDSRTYTVILASCSAASAAEKLGQRLFTSLVWDDPIGLIVGTNAKVVRREISAFHCVPVAVPKQIDPWKGPATHRYEIANKNGPILRIAVFDSEFPASGHRTHFVALGVSGFLAEGASDA